MASRSTSASAEATERTRRESTQEREGKSEVVYHAILERRRWTRVKSRERGSENMRMKKCTSRTRGRWALGRVADGRSDAVVPPLRSERGHKTILTVWLNWMPDAAEHTVHSVTLTRSVKRFASPSSFSRLDSNIIDI